jgi:hypothetical protein
MENSYSEDQTNQIATLNANQLIHMLHEKNEKEIEKCFLVQSQNMGNAQKESNFNYCYF